MTSSSAVASACCATASGVSQDLVSLAERGHIAQVSVRSLRGLAEALDAELRFELWFRGGELDRLLDEGHAAVVEPRSAARPRRMRDTRPRSARPRPRRATTGGTAQWPR